MITQEQLKALQDRCAALKRYLDIDGKRIEVEEEELRTHVPDFWNDQKAAEAQMRKVKSIKFWIEGYDEVEKLVDEVVLGFDFVKEELITEDELDKLYENSIDKVEKLELRNMLRQEEDKMDVVMKINAGAGGTEAQDWASMLMRMYLRWAERHGFTYKILDYQEGDEAGLKSADILIEGENAYGFLKGENGVHRLVRVSPFDANARRQTSFSAIEVIPEIEDDSQDVDIRPEDYEMQVYRSSGAGGQHINKPSSAVRLIHKATGIVVSCQTERSQFQNKETCLRMLRSKLVEIKEREHLDKIEDIKGVQKEIAWGSQIRNYVFMPYTLVKDTRTGCETSNVNAVMDGALDPFIESYLNCLATGNWVQK